MEGRGKVRAPSVSFLCPLMFGPVLVLHPYFTPSGLGDSSRGPSQGLRSPGPTYYPLT